MGDSNRADVARCLWLIWLVLLAGGAAPAATARHHRRALEQQQQQAQQQQQQPQQPSLIVSQRGGGQTTNLGCRCRSAWAPPGGGPLVNGSQCADVPSPGGATAGGAWCYTVESTCANNPKESSGPRPGLDFDFCGGDQTYAAERAQLLPLDRAASEGKLPPVPDSAEYRFARARGVAAFGHYAFTTQSGCRCSPWAWTLYNTATGAADGTFIGCADADPSTLPLGAWCPVDPRECPSYFGSFFAGGPAAPDGKMIYYDYCGDVRQRTAAGCLCQGTWRDNASVVHSAACARAPHWTQGKLSAPWCAIDRSTCTHVPAGDAADWHWDVCDTVGSVRSASGIGAGGKGGRGALQPSKVVAAAVGGSLGAAVCVLLAAAALKRRQRRKRQGMPFWGSGSYSNGLVAGKGAGGGGGGGGGSTGSLLDLVNGSGGARGAGAGTGGLYAAPNVDFSNPAAGPAALAWTRPPGGAWDSPPVFGPAAARAPPPALSVGMSSRGSCEFNAMLADAAAGSPRSLMGAQQQHQQRHLQQHQPAALHALFQICAVGGRGGPGDERCEVIRLWLMPVPAAAAAAAPPPPPAPPSPSARPRSRSPSPDHSPQPQPQQRVRVVLPGAPERADVDLGLSLARDLSFPLYSFIGAGAFAQVHRALLHGRVPVAVKLLLGPATVGGGAGGGGGGANGGAANRAALSPHAAALLDELALMSRVPPHPNIVACYGGSAQPPELFIVEELMERNLSHLIHGQGGGTSYGGGGGGGSGGGARAPRPLGVRRSLQVAADVAAGLFFLHPTVVHRDLKPQNILLDAAGVAKIADFGISRVKAETYLTSAAAGAAAGTVPYTAPECFAPAGTVVDAGGGGGGGGGHNGGAKGGGGCGSGRVSEKADIYSLGVILWECLTGRRPWAEHGHYLAIMYAVAHTGARPAWPPGCAAPPAVRRLVEACWRANPRERPSSGELLKRLEVLLNGRLPD